MSSLTTSATRRSWMVPAAVLIASAAASSHEVLLVPMISVTLYTLLTLSFDHAQTVPGGLPPACHRATLLGRRCRQVIAESAYPGRRRLRLHRRPRCRILSCARDDRPAVGTLGHAASHASRGGCADCSGGPAAERMIIMSSS